MGTALSEHLCRKGWDVHIVSRCFSGISQENLIFHLGSMDDRTLLEKILPECETVIHLASGTTPGSSAGKPVMEADRNILPTLKFLDMFRTCGNQRMIFLSSGGTLYGNPETVPVNEKHVLQSLSYHGAGKIAIETFLQAFAHDSGKCVTILRPSNLYGPGQSLRQGFGFIRTVLEHLRMNTEMEIWGDGESVRDFLYIQDMVNLIDLLITAKAHTDIYNAGAGKGHSLNTVIKTAEEVCGKKLKVKYQAARQVDVRKVVLDCTKIRKKLGWKSETSLEKGIGMTWEWILQE